MASPHALLALERSGLLQLAPGAPQPEYSFRHSLIHEVAYRSLLRQQRKRLHATVGQVLEDLYADRPEEIASELAEHFHLAEDAPRSFHYDLLAAAHDLRVYALHEALEHFDRALDAGRLAEVEASELLAVYLQRGRAFELSGQHPRALENYAAMEREASQFQQPRDVLRARLQSAILYCTASPVADPERGVEIARNTLEEARRIEDREAEARSLWILLLVFQFRPDRMDEALSAGSRALTLARDLERPLLQGMIANDLAGVHLFMGKVRESDELLTEARRILTEVDNMPMVANVIANQMLQRTIAGKYRQALDFSDEGYQVSASIGNLWGQACSLLYIDLVHAELGDYKQALDAGAHCLQLGDASGFMVPSVIANASQAWIRGHLGLHQEGLRYVDSAPTELSGPMLSASGMLHSVRALLHLEMGNLKASERAINQALEHTPVDGPALLHPSVLFTNLARAGLGLARQTPPRVLEITGQTLAEMRTHDYRLLAPDFHLAEAQAHRLAGDLPAAARSLAAGIALAEEMGSKRSLWQLLAERAEVLEQGGDGGRAVGDRQRARAIVGQIADNVAPLGLDETFVSQPSVHRLTTS